MMARFFTRILLRVARSRLAKPVFCETPPLPAQRRRFEAIIDAFLGGFDVALGGKSFAASSASIDHELQGFWFEGAAMGVVLRDRLMPWRTARWPALLAEAGDAHIYMLHVGAGWAMARLPGSIEQTIASYDPLLRWLLLDGYGFHEGFFHPERFWYRERRPRRVQGYAQQAFDQGLGRSMWFATGGEIMGIAAAIKGFCSTRRRDLWSGVGLAVTYAGYASDASLAQLREYAGNFLPQLAQGAAFGAKARQRAGNLTDYQERACQVLCGLSAAEAAAICDEALRDLPGDGAEPAFEIWRERIQHVFENAASLAS
jgi:hypothetical protein